MEDSLIGQKERLEEFKKWSGLTWKEISEKVGFPSTQNFTDMRNSRYRMKPNVAERIVAAFPEIRQEWLLLGTGPMLKSDEPKASGVPFYAGYVECGFVNPGTLFGMVDAVLKVTDSAMTEYPKNSLAMLRRLPEGVEPTPGVAYAVREGGRFVVRNIGLSDGILSLYPSCLDKRPDGNLLFAPIEISNSTDAEIFQIIGYALSSDGLYGITY